MYVRENREFSPSFFFFCSSFAACRLKSSPETVYAETKTPPQTEARFAHTVIPALMYHFPHLCSLCLHSKGSTDQDGLFLERMRPPKKMNSSSKPPSTAGAAVACQRDSVGFEKTKRTQSKKNKEMILNICSVNIRLL